MYVSSISNWSQVGHSGQHSHVPEGDTRVSLALPNESYLQKNCGRSKMFNPKSLRAMSIQTVETSPGWIGPRGSSSKVEIIRPNKLPREGSKLKGENLVL